MTALYNDIEGYPVDLLKLRVKDGWLPVGEVSNVDVRKLWTTNLKKFSQVHLFAGIGGFALACRMAGLPDAFRILTAGFPCQPFSAAGKRHGTNDNRYLWPETLACIASHRPDIVILENVAGLASMVFPGSKTLVGLQTLIGRARNYIYKTKELGLLDRICCDLEKEGYTVQAFIIPACGVAAPHQRNRIWIVAYSKGAKRQGASAVWSGGSGLANGGAHVANATSRGRERPGQSFQPLHSTPDENWQTGQFIHDGERCVWPVEPGVGRVVTRLSGRVDRIKGLGNSIVAQVAAEIISMIMASLGIAPVWDQGVALK